MEQAIAGEPELLPLGEGALILRWGNAIDDALNQRISAFAHALTVQPVPGLIEAAPAYCSVMLRYEMQERFGPISTRILERWRTFRPEAAAAGRTVEVPVAYGGLDLAAVARETGLSEARVVELHASREYRVYLMGFLPGFAYLGELDERIAVPRLSTPRVRVPAGSVGIAGRQTGVYPVDSPGGWRIIGRTPLKMFDASAQEPTLLRAGDRVRFVASA